MDRREAARWLAIFLLVVLGYVVYEHWSATRTAFGITRAMRGELVTVRAKVLSISTGKGHLFPILQDPSNGKMIKGVLFASELAPEEHRRQGELLEARRKDGGLLEIDGSVEIYKGELEIIISRVLDPSSP